MIHSCKVHCHALPIEKAADLNMDDPGKWLPFSFHLGMVIACKMTSDDPEDDVYNCTTIYTEQNDSYIINTPFAEFDRLFKAFNAPPMISHQLPDELLPPPSIDGDDDSIPDL